MIMMMKQSESEDAECWHLENIVDFTRVSLLSSFYSILVVTVDMCDGRSDMTTRHIRLILTSSHSNIEFQQQQVIRKRVEINELKINSSFMWFRLFIGWKFMHYRGYIYFSYVHVRATNRKTFFLRIVCMTW